MFDGRMGTGGNQIMDGCAWIRTGDQRLADQYRIGSGGCVIHQVTRSANTGFSDQHDVGWNRRRQAPGAVQ